MVATATAALSPNVIDKVFEAITTGGKSSFSDIIEFHEASSTLDLYKTLVSDYLPKSFVLGDTIEFITKPTSTTTALTALDFISGDGSTAQPVMKDGVSSTTKVIDASATAIAMYVAAMKNIVLRLESDTASALVVPTSEATAADAHMAVAVMTARASENWISKMTTQTVLGDNLKMEVVGADDIEVTYNPTGTAWSGTPVRIKIVANQGDSAAIIPAPLFNTDSVAAMVVESPSAMKKNRAIKLQVAHDAANTILLASYAAAAAAAAIGNITAGDLALATNMFANKPTTKILVGIAGLTKAQIGAADPTGLAVYAASLGHSATNYSTYTTGLVFSSSPVDGNYTIGNYRVLSDSNAAPYFKYFDAMKSAGVDLTLADVLAVVAAVSSVYQTLDSDGITWSTQADTALSAWAYLAVSGYDSNKKFSGDFSSKADAVNYMQKGDSEKVIAASDINTFVNGLSETQKQSLAAHIASNHDSGAFIEAAGASSASAAGKTHYQVIAEALSFTTADRNDHVGMTTTGQYRRQILAAVTRIASGIRGVDLLTNKGYVQKLKANGDVLVHTDANVGLGYGGVNGVRMYPDTVMDTSNRLLINVLDQYGNTRTVSERIPILGKIVENMREVYDLSEQRVVEMTKLAMSLLNDDLTAAEAHVFDNHFTASQKKEYVKQYCNSGTDTDAAYASGIGFAAIPLGVRAILQKARAKTLSDSETEKLYETAALMVFSMPNMTTVTYKALAGANLPVGLNADKFAQIYGHVLSWGGLTGLIAVAGGKARNMYMRYGHDQGLLGKLDTVDATSKVADWNSTIAEYFDDATQGAPALPLNTVPSTPVAYSILNIQEVSTQFTRTVAARAVVFGPALANPSTNHNTLVDGKASSTTTFGLLCVILESVLGADGILGDDEHVILDTMGFSKNFKALYVRATNTVLSDDFTIGAAILKFAQSASYGK